MTAKLALIGVLLLALLIPLTMVEGMIRERGNARAEAAADIGESWGNAQTIGGPVVIVPLRYGVPDRQGVIRRVADELYLLPRELMIEGDAGMQVLNRGIFRIPVYSASLSVAGSLPPIAFEAAEGEELEIVWDDALIAVPLSDPRALRDTVTLTIAGTTIEFEPGGSRVPGLGPMLTARIGHLDRQLFQSAQAFSYQLRLSGTRALDFRPDGDTTRVELRSDWPSPSFRGPYLPETRRVGPDGFEANWQILALGRGYPGSWRDSETRTSSGDLSYHLLPTPGSGFGVDFLVPVDIHSSSLRAIKYAGLYLAVTFAAFFLFEVFTKVRLHPVQYLSVGLANGVFYLLLLALGEHAGFGLAYLASATASTALISGYAAAILGASRRAWPTAALLTALYTYLYTTLRAEDFALLAGALGLFVLLTGFMYATRTVDWYALDLMPVQTDDTDVGDVGPR